MLVGMSDEIAAKQIAMERDRALDDGLTTRMPRLASLENQLYESYSVDGWGLYQFAGLADEEQRAVASDILLSATEGVKVNVREFALAVIDVQRLVGPNGRTMPGPTRPSRNCWTAKGCTERSPNRFAPSVRHSTA